MASVAEPVESGQDYTITHVDGRQPVSLGDFTGDIHLTLVKDEQRLDITGAVARAAGAVRFYQKNVALPDRDIRVWTITEQDDSIFRASPLAAF